MERAVEVIVKDLAGTLHSVARRAETLHQRGPVGQRATPVALVPVDPGGGRAQSGEGRRPRRIASRRGAVGTPERGAAAREAPQVGHPDRGALVEQLDPVVQVIDDDEQHVGRISDSGFLAPQTGRHRPGARRRQNDNDHPCGEEDSTGCQHGSDRSPGRPLPGRATSGSGVSGDEPGEARRGLVYPANLIRCFDSFLKPAVRTSPEPRLARTTAAGSRYSRFPARPSSRISRQCATSSELIDLTTSGCRAPISWACARSAARS